jgi:ATP-dependent Clp protease protease subunit
MRMSLVQPTLQPTLATFDPELPPPQPLVTWRDGPTLWAEWARAALYERRTVLLDAPLDDPLANQVAAEFMMLDAASDDPIQLHVNSAGGTLDAALMLIDVIDLLGVPVHALCLGQAEGAAFAVFAVAARRVAHRHVKLRLCDPPAHFDGSAAEVAAWAEQHARQVDRLCERLAIAAHRPRDEIADELRHGAFFDAAQAQARGYVDEIATPDAEVRPFPRRFGFHAR